MLLAGDVGGTKTLLGVFERAEHRPRPLLVREYPTGRYAAFIDILDAFALEVGEPFAVEAVSLGVAGPVVERRATLTNVPWQIGAADVAARLDGTPVHLLNDLEAMAMSVDVLGPRELLVLQAGRPRAEANGAIIAAGTGLGEAYIHRVNGRVTPIASEGGHADFAPRTDRELALVRALRSERGRVEVEDVLSGRGLLNLHRFTHQNRTCLSRPDLEAADAPATVTRGALDNRCPGCSDALAWFVEAFGAEAGNLALRGMAVGGVFVGGGIAPKILPALESGTFMHAFRDKGTMATLLAAVPVKVVLNPQAALIGAAVHAQDAATRRD
jgi:glucokinase